MMKTDYFKTVKEYLSRLRKWEVVIKDDSDYVLAFYLNNQYESKWFYLTYVDSEHELQNNPRPYYHHYYCKFNEENVPDGRLSQFVSLFDTKWFCDEEDVIYWIKSRQRIGR